MDADALLFNEEITTFFFELVNNPYYFNVKDELNTFPNNMIERCKQKLSEIIEEDLFKFKTTILRLILVHEYTSIKDYTDALKYAEFIHDEITLLRENHCEEMFYSQISVALEQILKTYKIYNLIMKSSLEEAQKVFNDVIPFKELNNENAAAVFGIRSAISMEYGLYGNKLALNYAKKANEMDPSNSYWLFLIGKSLGRIRRVEKPYDIPSDEERNALKKAIESDENYLFMLFAAQVYAETANRTYKFHSRDFTLYPHLKISIDKLNDEASTLYRKAIEKQPGCTHVLFRVAKGFMYLPYPQKDVEYAKALLLKGLQKAPRNPFANHLLAQYYERYGNDIDSAIKHLEICAEQNVFGAHMDLIKLKHQKNEIDVIEKLEHLLTIFVEVPRKLQIMTQMASYYIFVQPDLTKSCELMKECIKMNYDENILNHRSLFVQVKESFSLLDVLIDEIKIHMEKNCKSKSEDLEVYKKFLKDMTESNVTFCKGRAKNLKNKILQEEEEFKSKRSVGWNARKPKNKSYRKSTFTKAATKQKFEKMQTQRQVENETNSVAKVDNFFESWKKQVESSEDHYAEKSADTNEIKRDGSTRQHSVHPTSSCGYREKNRKPQSRNYNSDKYTKQPYADGGDRSGEFTQKRNSNFRSPRHVTAEKPSLLFQKSNDKDKFRKTDFANNSPSKNDQRCFNSRFDKSSSNKICTADDKELENSFGSLSLSSTLKREERSVENNTTTDEELLKLFF